VKTGDLVKLAKTNAMGIIVEVFADLDPRDPWIRVLFVDEPRIYQWCKVSGLILIKEKETP